MPEGATPDLLDVETVVALIRAAADADDEDEVRRLEATLAAEVDTRPRDGDPPQPEDQSPDAVASASSAKPTPDRIITRARGQLGTLEGPAKNQSKYGAWYGDNFQPWCAMFVSWVFHQEGLPLTASTAKGFEGCPAGVDWFRRRGCWSSTARRGRVVFFDLSATVAGPDHVGIVEDVHSDGSITTIEGNTTHPTTGREGVWRRSRRVGIVGYGIPDYPTTSAGDVAKSLPRVKRDQHGVIVRRVQGLLRAAYPELTDDELSLGGDFGPVTEELVKRLQADHGLTQNGEVRASTWRALLGLKAS
jgi:hypothetical protein